MTGGRTPMSDDAAAGAVLVTVGAALVLALVALALV